MNHATPKVTVVGQPEHRSWSATHLGDPIKAKRSSAMPLIYSQVGKDSIRQPPLHGWVPKLRLSEVSAQILSERCYSPRQKMNILTAGLSQDVQTSAQV